MDCLFDERFITISTMAEFLEGNEEDERKVMENTLQNKEKELYNVHPFFAYYLQVGYSDGLDRGYEKQFQVITFFVVLSQGRI